MISKLRKRIAGDESGFTLIELLVVIIILGILAAIAIPSYLSFKGKSNDAAAKSAVRSIVPSVEQFFSDKDTYANMNLNALPDANSLLNYDQAIDPAKYSLGSTLTATTYCVDSTSGDKTWRKNGPAAPIEAGACT